MTATAARGMGPTLASLRRDIESRFGLAQPAVARSPRIGAEIEFLVFDAVKGSPAPIEALSGEPATLPVLRELAARNGWQLRPAACGAPAFTLPNGGELSFEPGGQIEYAAPPVESATQLIADLRHVSSMLHDTLGAAGLAVGDVGIDPTTSLDDAPLFLDDVPRYREMDAYFRRIGRAGPTMMRQTAAFQVSIDPADDPREVWRVLAAVAPFALALFANSPIYERVSTGHQSYRAAMWRSLDGARTGCIAPRGVPDEYLTFALDAPAMLLGTVDGEYRPLRDWLERGDVTDAHWRTHLTTLFPEVRPRGHFEVRSCDAIPARCYAAPIAFLAGLAYHTPSRRAALEVTAPLANDAALLARAGICGVHDAVIRNVALELSDLALEGCSALAPRVFSWEIIDESADFVRSFPAAARSLADQSLSNTTKGR